MPHADSAMMESCARVCHECQDACLSAIAHGLETGGEHAARDHQTLLTDCAAICGVSHNLLHRLSPQHVFTCAACAEICRRCADSCEAMAKEGDNRMDRCATACRRCAESCESMSAAAH